MSLATSRVELHPKWPVLQQVTVPMTVRIPLPSMKLGALQALRAGTVLESEWRAAEEVPLLAGGVTLSWCEFAVVNGLLSARLTRLG